MNTDWPQINEYTVKSHASLHGNDYWWENWLKRTKESYYNDQVMENVTVKILSYWEAILKWFSECSTRQYKEMNEESDDHRWYYRWYWIERIITSDIERWNILLMSKAIDIELEEKWFMTQLWSVMIWSGGLQWSMMRLLNNKLKHREYTKIC